MNDPTLLAAAASNPAGLRVRVVYLARLREVLGCGSETLAFVDADETTVATILDHLRARGGAYAHELAAGRAFRVAVNHAMAGTDAKVRAGDEVAILPPVTGG